MRISSYIKVKTMMDKGFKQGLTLEQIFGKNTPAIKWCNKYLKLKEEFYKTGKISFDDVGITRDVIKSDFDIMYHYVDSDDISNCSFINYKWLFYDFANMMVMEYTDGHTNYYFCPDREYYDYDIARHEYFYHIFHGFWDKVDKRNAIKETLKTLREGIEYYYIEKGYNLDKIFSLLMTNNGKDFGIICYSSDGIKYDICDSWKMNRYKLNYEVLVRNAITDFKKYLSKYKEKDFPLFLSNNFINEKVDNLIKDKEKFLENIEETNSKRFNSSDEKVIYSKLCDLFGENNILKEYKSKNYPWNCDFYIKNLNTYIEYQGTWSHFEAPWSGTINQKLKALNILNKTTEKTKGRYLNAIKTWTITDCAKRKWARINNLNWIEFFNMDEVDSWIKNHLTKQ